MPRNVVFFESFEPGPQQELDEWPVGWVRRRGIGFPIYLPIGVTSASPTAGRHALRVGLNGGAAAVYSPQVEIDPIGSFLLRLQVRTEKLDHDRAFVSLTFLDADGKQRETLVSEAILAPDWVEVVVGPHHPVAPSVARLMVGLHVEPTGPRADLSGFAWFDEVAVEQVPRLALEFNDPLHLYHIGDDVVLTARHWGQGEQVQFEPRWYNHRGEELSSEALRVVEKSPRDDDPGETWRARWPCIEPGYYRLELTARGTGAPSVRETATWVVLPPGVVAPAREFGWTLPEGTGAIPSTQLGRLCREAAIARVKLPLVQSVEPEAARLQVRTVRELSLSGVEVVGMLTPPQGTTSPPGASTGKATLAPLLRGERDAWLDSLDPVLVELGWQVHTWQVGDDHDASLPTLSDWPEQLGALKKKLDRYGSDVVLGLSWPRGMPAPREGVEAEAVPFLAWNGLPTPLDDTKRIDAGARQAVLHPDWYGWTLPPARGSLSTRLDTLFDQFMQTKMSQAAVTFLYAPLQAQQGLAHPNGTPTEMFLPWRTLATTLGEAEYLGRLKLPENSDNYVYQRDGGIIIALPGEGAGRETLYWGDDIRVLDLWGRSVKPPQDGGRQIVEWRDEPHLVIGAHPGVTHWRLAMQLLQPRLPNQFGVRVKNGVYLKNTFGRTVLGTMKIVGPKDWRIVPEEVELRLNAGEEVTIPFTCYVPPSGTSGPHPVRFDFRLDADRRLDFSAYDTIEVGLGDLRLDVAARFDQHGTLIVEQKIVNQTERSTDFRCHLYVPGQRRLRTQSDAPARGLGSATFRIVDAQSLAGETLWLRCEEIGGSRVLSKRFVVPKVGGASAPAP